MNIRKAVDKSYENKTLRELVEAPVSALEGISERQAQLLGELGVRTIRDLGEWKFAARAHAIAELAKLEA